MKLEGEVKYILFQNELNGYTIAEFATTQKTVTIVGTLLGVYVGDMLIVDGEEIVHREYGEQIKVSTFEKKMPETTLALKKYLGNGNVAGIGEKLAERIVDNFKADTVEVLKYYPEKLAELKGVSLEKAQRIQTSFTENWEIWKIVSALGKFGITAEQAQKAFKEYGVQTIDLIEKNPYILIEISRAITFKQIDKIATQIGINEADEKRIQAGIKYILVQDISNGNSCMKRTDVLYGVSFLLGIDEQFVENVIINMLVLDQLVVDMIEDNEYVFLPIFYSTEKDIANMIKKLQKSDNTKYISELPTRIYKIEEKNGIELSEKQKDAIELININNVNVITGGPGTGKTTVIRTIIELYKEQKNKVVLAAPTGRAAKKMTEATGEEAFTLHRLLGINVVDDERRYLFHSDKEESPLDADVVIIDEVSMVDMFLMRQLLRAMYRGTKLILVGDSDQLASVGPGCVLENIIGSETIATVKLDKIFRQAAKSKIITNAHRVNSGKMFINETDDDYLDDMENDFFFIEKLNEENMLSEVISLSTGRLEAYNNYNFLKDIQILTPTKKGLMGTRDMNKYLQESINPKNNIKKEIKYNDVVYRVDDRIMQTKNNYEIEWEKEENGEIISGSGIFNGEIGIIKDIENIDSEVQVVIQFDDNKTAYYEYSELDQIEHSYSMTIHKSQGSEFNVVILVVPRAAPMLLTRNLLYTAITRAKKMIIVVGSSSVLQFMTKNIETKKRNTGLKTKLMRK